MRSRMVVPVGALALAGCRALGLGGSSLDEPTLEAAATPVQQLVD